MKIKYERLECACCQKVRRTLKDTSRIYCPDWFHLFKTTIDIDGVDILTCSLECLKKAVDILEKPNARFKRCKKENHVTICDRCGKKVVIDVLNPCYGGKDPLENWSSKKTPFGEFDFCSEECLIAHTNEPDKSKFIYLANASKEFLLKVIESEDFLTELKELLDEIEERRKQGPRFSFTK